MVGTKRMSMVLDLMVLACSMSAQVDVDLEKIAQKPRLVKTVTLAAYNSSAEEKAAADIVCTGDHDELVIQKVLDSFSGNMLKTYSIQFAEGTYKISSFRSYDDTPDLKTAIKIGQNTCLIFQGVNAIRAYKGLGAYFKIMPEAYKDVKPDEQVCVINISNLNGRNKNHIELRNFAIDFPDIKHKAIGINLFRAGGAVLENLFLRSHGQGPGKIPVEGFIGIRGQNVNPNGVGQYWKDIVSQGFYEAFQMGGEHLVAINLLAYQSYYGYTFGNYKIDEWGVWEHPLTLINCSEELCAAFPLFNICGAAENPNKRGMQCVDMISHTMEMRCKENPTLQEVLPAREVIPGTWCGNITFAANREALSMENAVDVQYWEKGSGHRFKTRNSAHAVGGTTAERKSYVPTYVQTYFDTDLNKLVIFNGNKWVDSNGHPVD